MKRAVFTVVFGSLALLSSCRGEPVAARPSNPADTGPQNCAFPDPDVRVHPLPPFPGPEVDPRMAWWRDARFGMFLHWGLYAIPAGKWKDKTDHAEWIMTTAQIPVEEYEQFLGQFDPVKFDADAWARMASDAGMKYVVITSKHHDGFALFDSKTSEYDVMATPFQRDILRELGDAVRRHGMQMCFYHSIMDWHHPDYLPRRDWEARSPEGADFARFRKYLFSQVTELLTNYGKVGVMWFDGEWESTWTNDYGKELYALCRKLQPEVIVNNRVSTGRMGMAGMTKGAEFPGDFGTPEQEIPATGFRGVDWETCMTMNDHWGFNAADDRWKSTEDLIRKFCDIASKGGNFLLNIGPRADGTFPPEAVERLAAIGRWMKVNGEAIHGTQASPFDALAFGRCTVRKDPASGRSTLYLHVFDWPANGGLALDGLGNRVLGARLLAEPARKVEISPKEEGAVLHVGKPCPDPIASVVAVEIEGEPVIFGAPGIWARRRFLEWTEVCLTTSSDALELRYTLDGSEPSMKSFLFEREFIVTHSCTVKARAYYQGRPVSTTTALELSKVPPDPALAAAPEAEGLVRDRYDGDFKTMPAFEQLQLASSEIVAGVALPEGFREERLAYVFRGAVRLPDDDAYQFDLTSDDGSRLWIDGKLVVDNDGLHGAEEKRGEALLAQGWHAIRVEWFNRTGSSALALKITADKTLFETEYRH